MDTNVSKFTQANELMQTKTAVVSVLPLLIGAAFEYYYYHQFKLGLTIILLISAVMFHFAINSYNQLTDYERFQQSNNTGASINNIIRNFHIPVTVARETIIGLTIISASLGLYITFKTNWFVLIVGLISYAIGFLYSGGPYPILKTPFSEPIAGLAMGYNITLLAVYVNIYGMANFDRWFWLKTLIVSLPIVLVLCNLMLANNTADYKEDIETGRHTLVFYIGVKRALQVWPVIYILAYIFLIAGVFMKLLPWTTLLTLLTIPIVYKNSMKFIRHPKKETTFLNAIFNIQIILVCELVSIILGIIMKVR